MREKHTNFTLKKVKKTIISRYYRLEFKKDKDLNYIVREIVTVSPQGTRLVAWVIKNNEKGSCD